jgi:hypothetical protein
MKKLFTFLFLSVGLVYTAQSQPIEYTMEEADYQAIVDAANLMGVNTAEYPDNTDNYFGASSYYSNFDIETDGSWNMDVFPTWEDAVQTPIAAYVLPAVFPDAAVGDVYRVYFTYYDGSNSGTDYFDFIRTDGGFAYYPGENGSTKAEIKSFVIEGQVADTELDPENATVELTMAPGTDVTALAPEITISTGATISPESGEAVDFTNPVEYTVTAEDIAVTKVWTVTVSVMEETITPIYDIQYVAGPAANDSSLLFGQNVIVEGIVTGFNTFGSYNKYYVQDDAGAWNGVYVYDNTTGVVLSVGDLVKLTGKVDEYWGVTEIAASNVEIISSRNVTPEPVVITSAITEDLEGILVTVENVEITEDTDEDDSRALLLAIAGDQQFKVYDELFGAFEPEAGKTYNLTGVVAFVYDHYRICPRSESDFEAVSAVNDFSDISFRVYPNPATDVLNISGLNANRIVVKNLLGQAVLNTTARNNRVDVSALHPGVYFIEAGKHITRFIKR